MRSPQQERDAEQEQEQAARSMKDRDDRRQRLADRQQIEINGARLDDRSFERGHDQQIIASRSRPRRRKLNAAPSLQLVGIVMLARRAQSAPQLDRTIAIGERDAV